MLNSVQIVVQSITVPYGEVDMNGCSETGFDALSVNVKR